MSDCKALQTCQDFLILGLVSLQYCIDYKKMICLCYHFVEVHKMRMINAVELFLDRKLNHCVHMELGVSSYSLVVVVLGHI